MLKLSADLSLDSRSTFGFSLINGVKAAFTIDFKTCFTSYYFESYKESTSKNYRISTHTHIKMFSYGLVASTNTTRDTETRLPAFRIWTLPAKSNYSFWTRKKKKDHGSKRRSVNCKLIHLFWFAGWKWKDSGVGGTEFGFIYRSYEHVGGDVSSHLMCPWSDLYMNKPNLFT